MLIPYVKSPLLEHDLVCQVCGVTSENRYVHAIRPDFFRTDNLDPGQNQAICGSCCEAWVQEHKVDRQFTNVADIDELVQGWLKGIGMGVDEAQASLERIPQEVLEAIPKKSLRCLMAGVFAKAPGFGLCSRPGLGKSQAVAAVIRAGVIQNATNVAPFKRLPTKLSAIGWMNVFLAVSRWRRDGIDPQVAIDVRQAQEVKLLILDDLGREVRRSAVGEDVATGHLDAIITHRDREGLPTIWTSNLSEDELLERYETPLFRRLIRLNPPSWIQ